MTPQEAIAELVLDAAGCRADGLPLAGDTLDEIAAFIRQQQDTIERLEAKDKDAHLLWLSHLGGGDRKRCMDILELTTGEQDG